MESLGITKSAVKEEFCTETGACIQEIFIMICLMDRDNLNSLIKIVIGVSSKKEEDKVKEFISIAKVPFTRESGKAISKF